MTHSIMLPSGGNLLDPTTLTKTEILDARGSKKVFSLIDHADMAIEDMLDDPAFVRLFKGFTAATSVNKSIETDKVFVALAVQKYGMDHNIEAIKNAEFFDIKHACIIASNRNPVLSRKKRATLAAQLTTEEEEAA